MLRLQGGRLPDRRLVSADGVSSPALEHLPKAVDMRKAQEIGDFLDRNAGAEIFAGEVAAEFVEHDLVASALGLQVPPERALTFSAAAASSSEGIEPRPFNVSRRRIVIVPFRALRLASGPQWRMQSSRNSLSPLFTGVSSAGDLTVAKVCAALKCTGH